MTESNIISPLDQEIVVMTLTTMTRLFELGGDAFILYGFYLKNAKLQSNNIGYTNKIQATRDFCLKGLRWGHKKYHRTKKLLTDSGFIEDVIRRNPQGGFDEHYVKINYLLKSYNSQNPSYNPSGSFEPDGHLDRYPSGSFEPSNAVNKNTRNAVNKKYIDTPLIDQPIVKKAATSHSKEADSNKTHSRLTYDEIYQIACRKNVSVKAVQTIERQVHESIEDGNKYKLKNVKRAVAKWIDIGVAKNQIQPLDEVGKMMLEAAAPAFIEEQKKALRLRREIFGDA